MNKLVSHSKRFLNRNASTILTCIGGAGVIATSVMAVKATPKALAVLEAAKKDKGEELTSFEIIKTAGPVYIPSILVGASTLACIFGANVLNKRKQAAITSAYALLDASYKEYKKKLVDLYGEEADSKIREEIAKDKYKDEEVDIADDKKLFYDFFSGRYFESTDKAVREAEYNLNRELSVMSYASLNDFYDLLKISNIEGGDDLGWSAAKNFEYYWQSWIDFAHENVTMDDGLECTIIHIQSEPTLGYEEY